MIMPKSKKPRKPHRKVSTLAGLRAASALSQILIRGNGVWTRDDRLGFGLPFLEPFAAIRFSKGTDPNLMEQFRLAKAQLTFAWGLTNWYTEEGKALEREKIARANFAFQTVFNVWNRHKKILFPQLKVCRELMSEQFETLLDNFEPYEIASQRYAMGTAPAFYDRAEEEMDSKLHFKEMNYV